MPIYKGTELIESIYHGDVPIGRVYHGEDLVYEKASGEGESPHRYWRLFNLVSQNDGGASLANPGNVGLAELDVTSSIGGSHLSPTITAIQSLTGRPVANIQDNNNGTIWSTSSSTLTGKWLKMDFGGSPVVPAEIILTSYPLSVGSSGGQTWASRQGPKQFQLQYSDNDTDWFDPIGVAANPFTLSWTITLGNEVRTIATGLV